MPTPRFLRAAVAVVLAVAALGACTVGGAQGQQQTAAGIPPLNPDQKVEIVFESYNLAQAGVWSDTINGLLKEFMAQHPNITVKGQPTQGASGVSGYPATVASVQTQLLAGKAPDVAQITYDSLDFTATELGAQRLDTLIGRKEIDEAFAGRYPMHPRARTLADWNGGTYGISYVFSTPVMFYNASLLKAAGVPENADMSTWAGIGEVATKVSQHTGKPSLIVSCAVRGGNWCMQGVVRSNGGRMLSEDRKTIQVGSPEAVGAVQVLRDLYDKKVLLNADSAAQQEAFYRGDAALMLNTSALQGMSMAAAKKNNWELRNTGMPAFGSKPVVPTNSGSALFIFSKDPARQRASWQLIKFMTSHRAYEEISTKIGYLPLRPALTEPGAPLGDWYKSNPLVAPNLRQLDKLEPWESFPGPSYTQIDEIISKAIEDSIFYGKDPRTSLAEAQGRAQNLVPK